MTRASLILLFLLSVGCVFANGWTVQTAAFQDYRQATSQAAELLALGFDAYLEFVMQDGKQYTRVRIGCYRERASAEAVAKELAGRITVEAAAQPLTENARTRACVTWDTGFLKPQRWELTRRGADVVFRVEVGGHVGYLSHDGQAWRLDHRMPPRLTVTAPTGLEFREEQLGGLTLVQAILGDGSALNVCSGRLLWHSGNSAVVERTNSVIACLVEELPVGSRR